MNTLPKPTFTFVVLLAASLLMAAAPDLEAARPSSRNVQSLSSQLKKEKKQASRPAPRPAPPKAPPVEKEAPPPPPPPPPAPAVERTSTMEGDQEIIVETVRGFTPSTDRIRPSGAVVQFWGIALVDAPLFDEKGKRRGAPLPGGSLVEQVGIVQSSKGEMAKVHVWNGTSWSPVSLVSTADLVRFEGGRGDVDAEGVEDLRAYYSLGSELEKRKAELVRLAAGKNPHYAPLKEAATAYNAHEARIKELTEQRDAAKGMKRSKLADELRSLEVRIQKEKIAIKELTAKYESWKAANGEAEVDFSSDPRCRAIEAKRAEIKPRLASFGL